MGSLGQIGADHDRKRLARFTEDPLVVLGGAEGPGNLPAITGWAARMTGGMAAPSKAIAPKHRIERFWPSVRVRVYFATVSGTVWISPGYVTIQLPYYALLKARGFWRRWRQPVPPARVVQR